MRFLAGSGSGFDEYGSETLKKNYKNLTIRHVILIFKNSLLSSRKFSAVGYPEDFIGSIQNTGTIYNRSFLNS